MTNETNDLTASSATAPTGEQAAEAAGRQPVNCHVERQTIERRPWEELRSSGLLWWINRTLHLFGWVIVLECEEDGSVAYAYPARTIFRGFSPDVEDSGFRSLTEYLSREAGALLDDCDPRP